MLASMQPEHEDHLRAGRLYALAGKVGAAKKIIRKMRSLGPQAIWLLPASQLVHLLPNKKHVERLLRASVDSAGAVILSLVECFNSALKMPPRRDLDDVIKALYNVAAQQLPSHGPQCNASIQNL